MVKVRGRGSAEGREDAAPERPAGRQERRVAKAEASALRKAERAEARDAGRASGDGLRARVARLEAVQLLVAAHPRQALATAAALAGVAALTGRAPREVLLVLGTVLVGQALLGWHNDLVDRQADRDAQAECKPLADGRADAGNAWFAVACGVLLLVPLAVANGLVAGAAYLLAVAVGVLGNLVLRGSVLSWLPWAVQFALYPAFLSYGGWGGRFEGNPPEVAITVLAAALGVCVHVLRALPGLVVDNQHGRRHLPLRLALKLGAPRLMVLAGVATAAVVVALLMVGQAVGIAA